MYILEHPIIGCIVIYGDSEAGITAIDFPSEPPDDFNSEDSLLERTAALLEAYLLGEQVDFSDIPLAPAGTPFQQAVWRQLCTIPWGKTRSYKWVATQLKQPNAVRAVGQANGKNPIPILIPCHRVVQHNGNLGGYSG